MRILLIGKKRSGKDSVANILYKELNLDYGFQQRALAGPIKKICEIAFGWDEPFIERFKEVIDSRWGISPRQALQHMGTEVFQKSFPLAFSTYGMLVGRLHWCKLLELEVKDKPLIITDIRFPHEVEFFKRPNDLLIKIIRPTQENLDSHESESYIDTIQPDITIINDGDLTDLAQKTIPILEKVIEQMEYLKTK